jgi:hypothetical protein
MHSFEQQIEGIRQKRGLNERQTRWTWDKIRWTGIKCAAIRDDAYSFTWFKQQNDSINRILLEYYVQ